MPSFTQKNSGPFVFLVILFLHTSAGAGKGQNTPLVRYVGHATILIQGTQKNVLTDPFWGNKILGGLKRKIPPGLEVSQLPRIDVVLVSHTHPDHYDEQAIEMMSPRPVVVVPWGRGGPLMRKGFQVVELRPWQVYALADVKMTAVPARHMFGNCLGYLIEMDGTRIYFTGDTKLHPDLDRLKAENIHLMLLPYGGYPVFGSIWTTEQSIEAIQRVNPKAVVPIHWGTFNRWWTREEPEDVETFSKKVKRKLPNIAVHILKVGESMSLQGV
jgi:L-ascorbate metabolism protein UlaG (beta-lactamase superfamily)